MAGWWGEGKVAGIPFWTSQRANLLIILPIKRCATLEQCSILEYLDDVVRLPFAPKGMNIYDTGHGNSYYLVLSFKIRRAPQQYRRRLAMCSFRGRLEC